MERMPAAQGLPARLWLPPSPPRFLPFSYLFSGSQPRGPCRWSPSMPACSSPSRVDAAWGSTAVRWTDATLSTDIMPATVAVTATTTIPGSIAAGFAADAARISHAIAMEYAGWPAADHASCGGFAAKDLFLHCARHCRDVVLNEEGIEDDEWQRADQGASHQRAPAVDITVNQRGHDRDRHGLVLH